ncbi:MAG: hypothetical protein AAGA62_05785 [Bacteroidota bacterium]
MDDFAKYLREQKEALDLSSVSPEIWSGIEREIALKRHRAKVIPFRRNWLYAAVIVLAMAITAPFLFVPSSPTFSTEQLVAFGFENGLQPAEVIEQKVKSIRVAEVPVRYEADFQQLIQYLEQIDQFYGTDVSAFQAGTASEHQQLQVLKYYQRKVEVLDKLLQEIQELNDHEKDFNSPSAKTRLSI